jgi:hypothetical protein
LITRIKQFRMIKGGRQPAWAEVTFLIPMVSCSMNDLLLVHLQLPFHKSGSILFYFKAI